VFAAAASSKTATAAATALVPLVCRPCLGMAAIGTIVNEVDHSIMRGGRHGNVMFQKRL
jgi:hypothetical protein